MAGATQLGQILLQAGVIDEFQLQAGLDEQSARGHRLGTTLVRLGFVAERDLVRALASQLALPVVNLDGKGVDTEVLELVPRALAEKHMVIPLFLKSEGDERLLFLGTEDPCDAEALAEVARQTRMVVRPVLVAASQLALAMDRLYRPTSGGPESRFLAVDEAGLSTAAADEESFEIATQAVSGFADATELRRASDAPTATSKDESSPSRTKGEAETRVILQALTQLLLEKELITRAELVERVAAVEAAKQEP